jgi:hypothetical protein
VPTNKSESVYLGVVSFLYALKSSLYDIKVSDTGRIDVTVLGSYKFHQFYVSDDQSGNTCGFIRTYENVLRDVFTNDFDRIFLCCKQRIARGKNLILLHCSISEDKELKGKFLLTPGQKYSKCICK